MFECAEATGPISGLFILLIHVSFVNGVMVYWKTLSGQLHAVRTLEETEVIGLFANLRLNYRPYLLYSFSSDLKEMKHVCCAIKFVRSKLNNLTKYVQW